jgi:hypothetical protein
VKCGQAFRSTVKKKPQAGAWPPAQIQDENRNRNQTGHHHTVSLNAQKSLAGILLFNVFYSRLIHDCAELVSSMKIMARNNSMMNRLGRSVLTVPARFLLSLSLSLSLSLKLYIRTVAKAVLATFCQGCFLSFSGHGDQRLIQSQGA